MSEPPIGTAGDHGLRTDDPYPEALRRSEERYRALAEASSQAVWSFSLLDDSHAFEQARRWWESLTGQSIAEQRSHADSWLAVVHPDDRAQAESAWKTAIAAGTTYDVEYRVVGRGGDWRHVRARGIAIRDPDGSVREWVGTLDDVTAQRTAEAGLARITAESELQRRMFESALSHTADFIYLFDLDGRFTFANKALLDLWGKTPAQAVGRNFHELDYPPELATRLQRQIREVIESRRTLRDETPYKSSLGTRYYEYIFVPVFGDDGTVEAVAGSTRDVTERRAAEESLRDADRKKDDFIALLAHELRNPLAPIRSGLEVLRLAEGDPETIASARGMMDRQLAHMVRLIDDLLDVSRVARNKLELRRAPVTLTEIVDHAVESARPLIQAANHELTVMLPPVPIVLNADLIRMAQVFSNLLTNSAKYTARGGRIWLSAERSGRQAVITVRDTGIGIPAQSLPAIFDMFSQVDRSVERNTGGLGIGLALVKGFVEMHGGTVTAESVEGQGSTFTVRLPIPEAQFVPDSTNDAATIHPARRRRMLVVDDSLDGAESMAAMLRLQGNEVATAHDGLQAFAIAADFRPEVILMDIGMPRLNGLDATRRIREQPWGRGIIIIALTGWGQESDREQSRKFGCDGHLVKPVNLADLEQMLRETGATR